MIALTKSHRPDVMELGCFTVVIPTAGMDLPPDAWAEAACAVILAEAGASDECEAMVARVERTLGVNEAHRRALASSPEAVRAEIRADKRRQRLAEHHRASRLAAAVRVPRPSEAVNMKLKEAAEETRKAADLRARKGDRKAIKAHETKAKLAQREASDLRTKQLDDDWRFNATSETVALAKSRGEEVESETFEIAMVVTDEDGVRVLTESGEPALVYDRVTRAVIKSGARSGLKQAYDKGHLDGGRGSPKAEALYSTGQEYGDAYAIIVGLSGSSGEAGGAPGPKGPQIRKAEAGETLAIMRAPLNPREREIMDKVCGEGYRVRDTTTRGGFPASTRRLRNALRLAMEAMKIAKEDGTAGATRERMKTRHRMIANVRA